MGPMALRGAERESDQGALLSRPATRQQHRSRHMGEFRVHQEWVPQRAELVCRSRLCLLRQRSVLRNWPWRRARCWRQRQVVGSRDRGAVLRHLYGDFPKPRGLEDLGARGRVRESSRRKCRRRPNRSIWPREILRSDWSNLSGRSAGDRGPWVRSTGALPAPNSAQMAPLDNATAHGWSNPLRPPTQHTRIDCGHPKSATDLRRSNRGMFASHQHATMRPTWATGKHHTHRSEFAAVGSNGMSAERSPTPDRLSGLPPSLPAPEDKSTSEYRYDWRGRLIETQKGNAAACLQNALVALKYAPEWQGVLQFDESASHVVAKATPPWKSRPFPFAWRDDDDVRAAAWLQQQGIMVHKEIAWQEWKPSRVNSPSIQSVGIWPDSFGIEYRALAIGWPGTSVCALRNTPAQSTRSG